MSHRREEKRFEKEKINMETIDKLLTELKANRHQLARQLSNMDNIIEALEWSSILQEKYLQSLV